MKEDLTLPQEITPHPKRETYVDEFGIERPSDVSELGEQRAHNIISDILENESLIGYLEIEVADVERIKKCAQYYKQLGYGLNPETPPDEDLQIYLRAIDILKSRPVTPPLFIVQDSTDPEIYHLCLEARNEKAAIKEDGTYYILYKLEAADSHETLDARISFINQNPYFPKVKFINKGDSTYIGVEFIPHIDHAQRGEDVSEFIESCKAMDFGPDTNVTNFIRHDGQLKYFDNDFVSWIKDPASQPFAKAALAKKNVFKDEPWDENNKNLIW